MAKLPASFIQRNHTYEVPRSGYYRTIPIEAVDGDTFKDKSRGTKGLLMIEPNSRVFLMIQSFLDDGRIGVFVEKHDKFDRPMEPFGILIERDNLMQLIEQPDRY